VTGYTFPVEAGHILAFRRAVGHPDGGDGDATAPPTFLIAGARFDPDYPLRPRPGTPWHGSAAGPGTALEGAGRLHAEQHFTYHRAVRAGDVLVVASRAGEEWEKTGRSGRLRFAERITEYRDQAGELVVTARSVSVSREEA
jgi:hypothetical protein